MPADRGPGPVVALPLLRRAKTTSIINKSCIKPANNKKKSRNRKRRKSKASKPRLTFREIVEIREVWYWPPEEDPLSA